MIYTVIVLLLTTGVSISEDTADNKYLDASKRQADYYLEHIANNRQAPLHYWALSQLAKDSRSVEHYITSHIEQYDLHPGYKKGFLVESHLPGVNKELSTYQKRIAGAAYKTGSPLLMLDLLTSTEDLTERKELYQHFQSISTESRDTLYYNEKLFSRVLNDEQFSKDILPLNTISFAHYILITRADHLFPTKYTETALKKWEPIIAHYSSANTPSLSDMIKKGTILRFSYVQRSFKTIIKLYDNFLSENYFPNSRLKLDLYKIQDLGSYRLGYFEKALTLHQKRSIPLSHFLKDRNAELFFLKHQGIFLYQIGNIKKSQEVYHEVLNKIEEYNLDLKTKKIDILNNLSLTYYKTGYFNTYLDYQSQALELAKKYEEYRYQLNIYRNLHIYHRLNKNWDAAQQYLDKAQQLASNHGQTRELAAVYTTTSAFYQEYKSDYHQAEKYLTKAQNLISLDSYYNKYITILSERGKLYIEMGKYGKARKYFDKLSEINKEKNDNRNYLNSLIRLADLELKLQNHAQVSDLISEINTYDLNAIDFEILVKYKSIVATMHHVQGDTDLALKTIRPAIEQVIQRARQSSDVRAGYWHVNPEYIDVLKTGVDLLLADNQPYKAVRLLDRIKTINEAEIFKNPLVKSNEMTKRELAREQQINEDLEDLRKQYLNAKSDEKLSLKNQINQLRAQRSKLYGRLSEMDSGNDFSLQAIQHQLPFTRLILHVTELKDTFYVGLISSNNVEVKRISLNEHLRTLFDSAIDSLAHAKTDLNDLYSIYNLLRLHEIPSYIKRISLIPDSYLYQLPLETLPVKQPVHSYSYGSARYLIENFEVNYFTSLSQFNTSDRPAHEFVLDFVGFGQTNFQNSAKSLVPLPFADQEIRDINSQLTRLPSKEIFLNQEATEDNFRSIASQSRIIHLATHSTINNREPLFSSIFLHRSPSSDKEFDSQGRIFAYELFEMDLNNQLIMMNSCESGAGPNLLGSGVMGLSRSLKYAGGNSLILNLWSVNDKFASEFASHLYHHLNKGESKATALRNAKQYFLQNSNANPHYWGPYMLLGDPGPIVNKESVILRYLTFGSFFLLMLMGIGFIYTRNKSD